MIWLILLGIVGVEPAGMLSVRVFATTDACALLRPGPDFEAPGEPRRLLGGWRGTERVLGLESSERQVLVDCGNFAAGSAEATVSWGRAAVRFMNTVGYDAATVGARDFNWGVQNLEVLARSTAFPVLADPMLDVVLNRQAPLFRPWVIRDLKGVRVALVGLSDFPTPGISGYSPGSPAEQLRRYLPVLAADSVDLVIGFGQLAADEGARLLDSFPGLGLIFCPDEGIPVRHRRLVVVPRGGRRLAIADVLVGSEGVVAVSCRNVNVLPADSGSAGLERLIAETMVAEEDSVGPHVRYELSPLSAAATLAEACRVETGAEVVVLPLKVLGQALRAGRPQVHELRLVAPFEDRLRLVVVHDTVLHALVRSAGPDQPAPMVAGSGLFVLPGGEVGWPRVRELARLRLPPPGPTRRMVTTDDYLTRAGMPGAGRLLPRTLTAIWLDYVRARDTLPAIELPGLVSAGSGVVPSEPLVAQPVNINTADLAALQQLPGVGPKTAERIIEHRVSHGPFRSVGDLASIRGIGPKTVERLRPLVTVR